MYAIDITRKNEDITSDMLVGKDSMEAKRRTMDYIMDYAFANYGFYMKEDVLDQYLNIDSFSLKRFLNDVYSLSIDDDLLIQSFPTDKDNCLFVKSYDENKNEFPLVYVLNKNDINKAKSLMTFIINDTLILDYQDDLPAYEKLKEELANKDIKEFYHKNMKCEIVSLYKGGLFLEELLNNATSLKQLDGEDFGGIEI